VITAIAIASISAFVGALLIFDVAGTGVRILSTAKKGFETIQDERLDDEAREKASRHASIQLARLLGSILIRCTFTLLISFLPIWLAAWAGLAPVADVVNFLARWDVLGITTLVIAGGFVATRMLWSSR